MREATGDKRLGRPPHTSRDTRPTFLVRMAREGSDHGPGAQFSCSSTAWDLLLEVGMAFGWKPRGTTYVPAPGTHSTDSGVRHTYEPGGDKDYKRVAAEDAIALAMALSTARRSPHLAAMVGDRPHRIPLPENATADQQRNANAPIMAVMDEFVEYAFGGAFSFARAA